MNKNEMIKLAYEQGLIQFEYSAHTHNVFLSFDAGLSKEEKDTVVCDKDNSVDFVEMACGTSIIPVENVSVSDYRDFMVFMHSTSKNEKLEIVELSLENVSKEVSDAILKKLELGNMLLAPENDLSWLYDESIEKDVSNYIYKIEAYDKDRDRYYLVGACDYIEEAKTIAIDSAKYNSQRTDCCRENLHRPDIDCFFVSDVKSEKCLLYTEYNESAEKFEIKPIDPVKQDRDYV